MYKHGMYIIYIRKTVYDMQAHVHVYIWDSKGFLPLVL